jgi:hypothetical protein
MTPENHSQSPEPSSMKQDKINEEAKQPQADKKPHSNFTSLVNSPIWFFTSLIFLLTSLVSLVYIYLRNLKSRSRSKDSVPTPPLESQQPDKSAIKNKPAFDMSVEVIKQPEQMGNPITKWFESFSNWSVPELTPELIKKISFSVAGPLLALVIAYFSQSIFDTIRAEGGLRNWAWLISMSQPSRLWLGAGGYLISMLVWAFTAPSMQSIGAVINQPDLFNTQGTRYHPVRFLFLFSSISVYLISIFCL